MVFIRTVLVKIKSLELFMKMVMGVTRCVENQNKSEICDLKGQKETIESVQHLVNRKKAEMMRATRIPQKREPRELQ